MADLPPRPELGFDLTERAELEVFLDFHRTGVHHKIAGLSEDDAWRRIVASLTTAAGVVKHLTYVERFWFRHVLAGESELSFPWTDEHPDGDFERTDGDTLETLVAGYAAECDRSRDVAAAMRLDERAARARPKGRPTLHWVLVMMIQETSRHNGHLDLIREKIDGQTGE